MPVSTKTEWLLAKADPISDGGSASDNIYKKGVKNTCSTATGERSENMWEKQPSRQPGWWRKRGRRCSRCRSRDSHAACEEPHVRAGGCPKLGCDTMGNLCWSKLQVGLGDPQKEKPTLEQVHWHDLWRVGNPWWNCLFLKDYTSWKGSMLKQFVNNCSL